MKLLLDTHAFIWAVDNPLQISPTAMDLMQNPENELFFSVGSMWEIAIKVSKDKLPLSIPYRPWLEKAITDIGTRILPIEMSHMELQIQLPWHHKDPFDRLLIAQAQHEKIPIISSDDKFDLYQIRRIWD